MTKSSILVGGVVVAVVVGGGLWWRSHQASGPAKATVGAGLIQSQRGPQAVTVFTVVQQDVPVTVQAAATVVPLNTVELRPQQTTTVRRVAIREGQAVRQGDLLFTLDDRTDQANLDKARATLLRDQATLADLKRQWQRAVDLQAQQFVAQGAVDTALSLFEAQQALVASDAAAVRAAEATRNQGSLYAPLSGRTGAITVHEGSLVTPAGAALVTISQIDPIGVSFSLPQDQLAGALSGVVGHALQVKAAGAVHTGKVSFMDNTVDVSTGTLRLKGELPNPGPALWPGQDVVVSMTLDTLRGASVVPQSALIVNGDNRQVYVVDAQGLAQLRKVQLRFNAGAMVAVEGVQVGEQVVLEGKQNLRPGTPVKVQAAGAASGVAP
jgi:RND family efflux transporter MFP subunit